MLDDINHLLGCLRLADFVNDAMNGEYAGNFRQSSDVRAGSSHLGKNRDDDVDRRAVEGVIINALFRYSEGDQDAGGLSQFAMRQPGQREMPVVILASRQ